MNDGARKCWVYKASGGIRLRTRLGLRLGLGLGLEFCLDPWQRHVVAYVRKPVHRDIDECGGCIKSEGGLQRTA